MNHRFLIDKLYRNSMFCETLGVVYSKDLATVQSFFTSGNYCVLYRKGSHMINAEFLEPKRGPLIHG
jgi:hypothetical protein